VVEEAELMADEAGLPSVTMAALAGRLGVRQPSLYKHIDGMDGLQRSMAIRAKTELAGTLARATVGRARGDAIASIAHAYRDWALQHPGRCAAAPRLPDPGDSEAEAADWAAVEIVGAILAGYDLQGDDAIDATRALRAALHGFVTLETTFVHPADIDRSFDRLVRALTTALDGWAENPARTPSSSRWPRPDNSEPVAPATPWTATDTLLRWLRLDADRAGRYTAEDFTGTGQRYDLLLDMPEAVLSRHAGGRSPRGVR
jgi:AcrR family transcriptional regulator